MATTTDHDTLSALADDHLDAVIAAMAGPDATPRDDQRAAVRALVADRTGCWWCRPPGGGSRRCTGPRPPRSGPTGGGPTFVVSPLLALMRDQIDAAERAGLRGGHDQLHQRRRLGRHPRRVGARQRRRAARLPRTARQPGVRPPATAMLAAGRAHRHRRSALHLRLGLRLPARLPAPLAGAAHQARPARPCWPPPPPPTSGSPPTSPRQLGDATVVLRGGLARSSLRLSVVDGLGAARALRLGRPRAAPRCPARASSTCPPSPRPSGSPATCRHRGHDVAAYSGQLDPAERASRSRTRCATTSSRPWSRPRRWAWATTSPTSASACTSAHPTRPSPTTSRSAGPGAPSTTPRRCCSRPRPTSASGSTSPPPSIPEPRRRRGRARRARRRAGAPMSVPALESATGLRRGPARVAAAGDRGRRRGRAGDGGWVATGCRYVYDQAKWDERPRRARRARPTSCAPTPGAAAA